MTAMRCAGLPGWNWAMTVFLMKRRSVSWQGMFTCPRGLNFRHLLERHSLTEAIFSEVNAYLAENGMTLRSGTLVDATIIDAPSSAKNKAGKRDPDMSSRKKGNDWYFGMKAQIGVDAESGLVHSLDTSTVKMHDSRVWDDLLHGSETSVWAGKRVSALNERKPSPGPASSGVSCARLSKEVSYILMTTTSTASSPRSGPESSIRSGC